MRKAMQIGAWLVLMASAWVASPSIAQEGPPPEVPGRVESDPQLAAASQAWHDAWRSAAWTAHRAVTGTHSSTDTGANCCTHARARACSSAASSYG